MIRTYNGLVPDIHESAYVDPLALVEGEVIIGQESSIWPFAVLRGDIHYIKIGNNSNVQDSTVIHVTPEIHPVIIGDNVTIGHNVTLHGCTIGNNCLIGMGAIILDGAIIEDNTLVAAGSLVPEKKKIPAGYLALGVPAKPFRLLTDEEIKKNIQNAVEYREIALKHKTEFK